MAQLSCRLVVLCRKDTLLLQCGSVGAAAPPPPPGPRPACLFNVVKFPESCAVQRDLTRAFDCLASRRDSTSEVGLHCSRKLGGRPLHPRLSTDSNQALRMMLHNQPVGSKLNMPPAVKDTSSGLKYPWSHLGPRKARNPATPERTLADVRWGRGSGF